jgi:demethylmenaquinone methyltransferase/2-methoxy-6-polyprenyl-1,4-benzoquinol methylase
MKPNDDLTHFGYQQVPVQEKAAKVAEVFHQVAPKYDLMNDLMSLGIHRLWKRMTVDFAMLLPHHRVLDLAGGTGDLAIRFAPKLANSGQLVLADINAAMLNIGRDRLLDAGYLKNVHAVQANAECLPFAEDHFDLITMAFGLRNVTDKSQALASMLRVLKPGGKAMILEFSKPMLPGLKPVYDAYSFRLLPKLGALIAKDADSYRYLAESIRMHPDQHSLQKMMDEVGFIHTRYHNFSGGIVALHIGYK